MSKDLDKKLKDYEEFFARPAPFRYDVLFFSDDHRRMDALLRRHYDSFHPLVRDIFTSFSMEFSTLLEEVESLREQMTTMEEETAAKQRQLDQDLDERFEELKEEGAKSSELLQEKDMEIEDLTQKLEQQAQLLQEKEALVVTQRRQLDLYIEEQSLLHNEQQKQQEQVVESIEHVSEFADQLLLLEKKMREMEEQRQELQEKNRELTRTMQARENKYNQEIQEITKVYESFKQETAQAYEALEKLRSEKEQYTAKFRDIKKQYEMLEEKSIAMHQNNKALRQELEKPSPERKIVSVESAISKKKWTPKKTSLEAELEKEVPVDHIGDTTKEPVEEDDGRYNLIEKELKLDESVAQIQSRLDTSGHDLMDSIRQSQKVREPAEEPKPEFVIEEVDAPVDTPNFGRMLAKLDGQEEEPLFTEDFPTPPKKDKKKTQSKSDRTPLKG
ncbi:MAG: hypothetical protein ACXAE3_05560 [Candidatus Kariarchaeaceae archaeon]|jgi:DNA repair exonuclease SbcCD ATPase subunit